MDSNTPVVYHAQKDVNQKDVTPDEPLVNENQTEFCENLIDNGKNCKRQIDTGQSSVTLEKVEPENSIDSHKRLKSHNAISENYSGDESDSDSFNEFLNNLKCQRKKLVNYDFSSDDEPENSSEGPASKSSELPSVLLKNKTDSAKSNAVESDAQLLNENSDEINMDLDLSTKLTKSGRKNKTNKLDSDKNKQQEEKSKEKKEESILNSVFNKGNPTHAWFVPRAVMSREFGGKTHHLYNELFSLKAYGSLHMVQRLELMYKLRYHKGCVNTLHFNSKGTKLASSSDDLFVCIWKWDVGKPFLYYPSGHRQNVFQVKFLPFWGDTRLVSCARDGQVRLAELSPSGACNPTKRLAAHKAPVHKLTIQENSPYLFMSAGEDGVVNQFDIREDKPSRILTVIENEKKVPLYSIHANPFNRNEFTVGGKDPFVRIYDKRKVTPGSSPLKKCCPSHLRTSEIRANVTCCQFNYNGTEVLASYNDDDIYLFSTQVPDTQDALHQYRGHRNNATVKGVNFFGPKSEFIVSGSDCGNIYFWDKKTESIVQFMAGDESGVVNCLEPHPNIPVLATSGLDDDVKIWIPSCERPPEMIDLKKTVVRNMTEREAELSNYSNAIDGDMLWILWRHFHSSGSQGFTDGSDHSGDSSSDESDSDESSDTGYPGQVSCATS